MGLVSQAIYDARGKRVLVQMDGIFRPALRGLCADDEAPKEFVFLACGLSESMQRFVR